jgi:hypothetical protein
MGVSGRYRCLPAFLSQVPACPCTWWRSNKQRRLGIASRRDGEGRKIRVSDTLPALSSRSWVVRGRNARSRALLFLNLPVLRAGHFCLPNGTSTRALRSALASRGRTALAAWLEKLAGVSASTCAVAGALFSSNGFMGVCGGGRGRVWYRCAFGICMNVHS